MTIQVIGGEEIAEITVAKNTTVRDIRAKPSRFLKRFPVSN